MSPGSSHDIYHGVYLGIGSNIEPKEHIDKALGLLRGSLEKLSVSPVYQNPAEGFDGDDFLNLVVGFEYSGALSELLVLLDKIEQQCGRKRHLESGKGSRTIDLDLLAFGDLEGIHNDVELPRPEIFQRQFVWQPLLDLFAQKDHLNAFELAVKSKIETETATSIDSRPMMAI